MNRLLLVVLALLLVRWAGRRGGWLMPAGPSARRRRAAEQKPGTGKEQQPAYQPAILTETNNREQARLYADAEQPARS